VAHVTDRNALALIFAALLLLAPAAQAGQASPPPAPKPPQAVAAPATPPSAPAPALSPATPTPSPAPPADPDLAAAENLIGKALFLRGFYASNSLAYDAAGKVEGAPKTTDWTLAAVNVLKAARQGPGAIELEGVRVAIRYNPDAHEFQRHPLNDEKMKLLLQLPASATPRQIEAVFNAIFSIGIDPALQRSMPPLWRHYFDPNLPWPPDALSGVTGYPMFGQPDQPKDVTPPILAHKADAEFTDAARHDNVKGQVQLRMVVDAQGVPQRIAVTRPLGYGLEERAAAAMAKWRFNPAIRAGQPVAAGIVVNLDFETAPPPR
jgi:TonB family protein